MLMKIIKSSVLATGFLFLISGCGTTSNVGEVWFGTGVNEGWDSGGVIRSHFSTNTGGNVRQSANGYCSARGLIEPTITYTKKVGEYFEYSFTCQKAFVPPALLPVVQPVLLPVGQPPIVQYDSRINNELIEPTPMSKNEVGERFSLDVAKKKCTELGFKPSTEGFGKCVLQLSR